MKLIRQKYNYHVSLDTVKEFETVILSDSKINAINETNKTFSKVLFHLWNIFLSNNKKLPKKIKSKNNNQVLFAVLMGTDFSKCLPYFFYYKNKNIFMFDAWPKDQKEIIKFLNFFKIKNAFFTSFQATETIQLQASKTNCIWIPEGINPKEYKYYSFKDKTIDVLALGRRYDIYHNQIVDYLENNNRIYIYETQKGKIIFPKQSDFIDGLAKAKISICVPSSITHPDRSGNLETMTIRYLQSIVSKCIILGHAPKEMIDLFGYNPVIEIDIKNPKTQIEDILNNYTDYLPLIEKNYQTVVENHTWVKRWKEIKNVLN